MNFLTKRLSLLVLLCHIIAPAIAQNYPTDPGTQYAVNGVDPSTLNVSIHVPIISKAGLIPFSTGLTFDNSFWHVYFLRDGSVAWGPDSSGNGYVQSFGWLSDVALQYGVWTSHALLQECGLNSDSTVSTRYYSYVDAQGVDHPLVSAPNESGVVIGTGTNSTGGCSPHSSWTALANDGSGITLKLSATVPSTVVTAGGTILTPPKPQNSSSASMVDVNGNSVSESPLGTFTDSVGVPNTLVLGGAQSSCPIGHNTFTYQTSTGTAAVTVNCVTYTVQTNFACTNVREFNQTGLQLVDNVVLGDGVSTYHFTYESQVAGTVTGRLASVTYPNGAVVSYTYNGSNYGTDCTGTGLGYGGGTLGLTVTDSLGSTTYTRSGLTTTVISPAPASNKTVYTFSKQSASPMAVFETQVQKYQGSSTPLETDLICYNTNQSNCATATAPTFPITQVDTYSTLTGMSSKRHTILTDSYGNVTEEDSYDYGASSPSIKAVASSFGYTWNGSISSPNCTASIGNGIMDRPCLVRMQTGSGSTLRTYYRQYSSTGQVLQTGALVGSSYITTSATYYTNGSLATATDYNGFQTTYTQGACNGQGVTQIMPPISTLGISSGWDTGCAGNKLVSITGPNGFPVGVAYNDPLWRVTSTTDQMSVGTNYSYASAAESESTLTFNGSTSTNDVYTKTFPLSNTVEVQTLESPGSSNWDTKVSDFMWDSTGVKNESWMPCIAAKGSTCGTGKTTVTHDALGRTLVITDGGNGAVTNSYFTSSTKFDVLTVASPAPAGEVVKQAQREYNGLGQLLSECLISSATGYTSCGQAQSATGFVTSYSYNPDGTLQSVVRGSQTHAFTYDGIGRMISKAIPESGTKQFFYDSAPSSPGVACSTLSLPTNSSPVGNLVKTYDANGTTACYSYDTMGSTTGIAYSGPNVDGLNKYFVYDSAVVNNVAMTNALGRLAEAYTAATIAGTKVTDKGFSYSPRGQVSDVYQWSTHSAGWYHTSATYFDNGAVNTVSGVPSQTPWTYGLDGKGRTKTAALSSTNMVTNVTYNAGNQPCVVTLGLGDTDTYQYDGNTNCASDLVTGRMSSYDFAIGATPKHLTGTLSWNTNGTLRGLSVVDGINAGADSEACDYGTSSIAGYDELGRLLRVNCMNGATAVWGQNFAYDQYNNLTKTVPTGQTGTSWIPGYDPSSNHYMLAGTSYDSNGNLLTDSFHTYTWNQDNHVKTIDSTITMTYDAFGKMVEKYDGTSYWQELDSPIGNIALMKAQSTNQYRMPLPGGGTAVTGISFEHVDYLGNVPLVSSRGGRTSVASRLFSPYGESYNNTGITGDLDFTGDRQDLVAGSYDTPNRELNPVQTRWLSPDPAGASWNAYQSSTNPMGETDPSGLNPIYLDGFPTMGWSIAKNGLGFSNYGWTDKDDGYDPNHPTEGDLYRELGQLEGTWPIPQLIVDPTHGGHLSSGSNSEGTDVVGSAQNQSTVQKAVNAEVDFIKTYIQKIDSLIPFSGVSSPATNNGVEKAAAVAGTVAMVAAGDGEASAASRAGELANAMGKTKNFVTIGVTETAEGVRVISSSENALRPGVRAMLGAGEVAATGAGHAEVTGVNAAKQMGLTPTGVAASRPICPSCAQFLRNLEIDILSVLK